MRATPLKCFTSLAVLGLLVTGCGQGLLGDGGGGGQTAAAKDEPIVLGMLIPQSGSEAAIGPYMSNAAQLAIDEINAKGGVLGRKLELRTADDACDAQSAAAGANKLVTEGVDISVGGYCSGATLPTLPIFGKAGIPMIIPAANSQELVDQKLKHVFLINGTGSQQAAAAEKWIAKQESKSVALMHDNTSYSKDIALRTQALLEAPDGAEAVITEAVTPKESDYSANITKRAGQEARLRLLDRLLPGGRPDRAPAPAGRIQGLHHGRRRLGLPQADRDRRGRGRRGPLRHDDPDARHP
ncbi:hypothetical protein GCM10018952_43490 [Streptosporangium vulgare]